MTTQEKIRAFAYGQKFELFILGVIVFNAIMIGIQTYMDSLMLKILDKTCVAIFIVEIILKFTGRFSTKRYFSDAWNWFDIIIVTAALMPFSNGATTVLRVIRVFRVLRIIRFVPELRLITGVLGKSLKSMTYIGILLMIVTYIYAIIGVELFGAHMKEYATLHESFFSLFRSLTAEDWTDLRYEGLNYGNYWIVTFYHVSWIIVGTFVMINLVVGAILNNYNEVQVLEAKRKRQQEHSGLLDDETRLRELLAEMHEIIERREDWLIRKSRTDTPVLKPGSSSDGKS